LKFLKADIMGKEGGMVHTKAYVEPLAVDQLVAGQAWLARASSALCPATRIKGKEK
jgi:hypothetical protein